MSYEGPEYWYVIYKAVADFGDLMRDAAQARQALQGMADAAKAESAAEVAAAGKAAQSRQQQTQAIQSQSTALSQLADAAKRTNTQLLFGGRNDIQQHLSDLSQQLNYTNLLNRAQWMGFSSVQQAMSYRQQMYNQKLLENRAEFAGYQTADQYLGYMTRRATAANAEAAAIENRAGSIQDETTALLAYDNALQGTHSSASQLSSGISSGYAAALTGLPSEVTTRLTADSSQGMAAIAAYRSALESVPGMETTALLGMRSGSESMLAAPKFPTAPLTERAQPVLGGSDRAAAEELAREMAALSAMTARPRIELEGADDAEAEADALSAALDALDGTEVETTADFDDTEAGKELVKYTWWVDHVPGKTHTTAEFDDTEADAGLQALVNHLVELSRQKMIIGAELNDHEALAEAEALQAKLKSILAGETETVTERMITAGSGGSGAGNNGPPPAGGGGDFIDPDDEDAARALAEEMERLRGAEKEAGDQAGISAEDFLRMAGEASNGAKAYAYVQAAALAAKMAMADMDAPARANAEDFLRMAAGAESGAKAYAYVQAAAQVASGGMHDAGTAARDTAGGLQAAAAAAAGFSGGAIPPMVDGLVKSTGGWFGLNSQLRLFGGLLPGIAGHVAVWHILIDSLIETLASGIPAIVTMLAGLGAYAAGASDAAKSVYMRLMDIHTASDALQQTLPPMTDSLEKLHDQLRPQVWELYGDAIDIAHQKTGLFNQLATETSGVLDRMAARIEVDMTRAGSGLDTFFKAGGVDLSKFGQIFLNLGDALLALIKVTQETHIDQYFLDFFIAVTKLLDVIAKLPTPLLAAAFALHAIWLWGGLAATVVMQLLSPLRSLALALGAVKAENVEGGLASMTEDASGWARLKAGLTDIAAGFGSIADRIRGVGSATRTAATDASAASAAIAASGGEDTAAASGVSQLARLGETAAEGAVAGAAGEAAGAAEGGLLSAAEPAKSAAEAVSESVFGKLTEAVHGFTDKFRTAVSNIAADLKIVPSEAEQVTQRVANVTGRNLDEVKAFRQGIEDSGQAVGDFAASTERGAVLTEKYGKGLEGSAADAVSLAVAMNVSEAHIGQVAAGEGEAAAKTGLFSSAVANLGGAFGKLGVLAIAAAVGYLAYRVATAKDATQQWIDSVNKGLGSSSLFTVIGRTMGDLAATTQQLTTNQNLNAQSLHELGGAQSDLTGKLSLELSRTGEVAKTYGVSMPMALALMNAAGVKTSSLFSSQNEVWEEAKQQVKGLVDGYAAMGQGLSELQRAVTVQLVVSSDQYTAMQKLNQAYDTFQGVVAAPYTDVLTLASGLATFTSDAKAAGASMTGLSPASVTLQQQFQTTYGNVEQLFDAMRNSEAITGSGGFTQAVKLAVAALLPLAGHNKAAAAEISQLAQEAGGPATTSLQSLHKWAGNTADPLTKLYDAAQKAASQVSNLDSDGARLTSTLQKDLNPALANATFTALGGQAALSKFSTDLMKLGPNSKVTIDAGKQVAEMFLSVDKNSKSAKAQFVGWAESMGLSKDAAGKLWGEVSKGEKPMKNVQSGLAQSGTDADHLSTKLGKTGLLGQMRDLTAEGFQPPDSGPFKRAIAADWSAAYESFERGFGSPVAHWFDTSLPHFFTGTVPADWSSAYGSFMRGFGSPVASFFSRGIPGDARAMASDLSSDWKSFSTGFMREFGSPVASFFTKDVPGFFTQMGSRWATAAKGMWTQFSHNVVSDMEDWALKLFVGWGGGMETNWRSTSSHMWKDFSSFVTGPMNSFFTKTIPGWLDGEERWWGQMDSANAKSFQSTVATPLGNFFTKTIPGWYDSGERWWSQSWSANGKSFSTEIISPLGNFFSKTVPGWFNAVGRWWDGLWDANMKSFRSEVVTGTANFFTKSVPGWFNNMGRWWDSTWSANMKSFENTVMHPMEHWFSSTLPAALEGGFKAGINWVIKNVIDQTIKFINTDILGHLPGGLKVPMIGTVAHGGAIRMAGSGSVPGTGDEDGTHIIAMGGEYMLRKPARMALDQAMGPDFLNRLNQADSWLGSGSRGNTVSQRSPRGYAGGGGILGGIEGFLSGAGNVLTSGARDLAKFVTGGASELKTLAGEGAEKVFDAIWSGTIAKLFAAVPGDTIPGALVQSGANALKKGIESFLTGQDTKASNAATAEISGGISLTGVANSSAVAALRSAAAKKGWSTGAEWAALNNVEMREAGYNIHAQNPTSDAYGMAQFINGASEYAQYGGNANTAAGQAVAMINYIAQRYGDPERAWAHEESAGWYASGGAIPAGMDAAQAWNYYAGLLPSTMNAEVAAFWNLNKAKLPRNASRDQWAAWYADLGIMQQQQLGTANGSWGAYRALSPNLGNPTEITKQQWATFASRIQTELGWLDDRPAPPSSEWHLETSVPWPKNFKNSKGQKPGHIPPSAWPAWHYENGLWSRARTELENLAKIEAGAASAWTSLWGGSTGAGVGTTTPGVVVTPEGGTGFAVNLASLVGGGPAAPVNITGPSASSTGSGFAMGGAVGGDGASLGAVAAMFAGGGPTGLAGGYGVPDMSRGFTSQATAAGASMPRTVSAAASGSGDKIGVQVGSLTVNNPVPEKPSDSIARSSNRLAFLAGRGIA